MEGLSVDDEGVLFNGIPFGQASAAERLKVSVAMAMSANPELRVICIRDASLLDSDSKTMLVEMAKQHDYQIWYEVVGDGGPAGIIIEDGEEPFRELEAEAVRAALSEHDGVVSLGGGAVVRRSTRELLAQHPVVFLDVAAAEAVRRVADGDGAAVS